MISALKIFIVIYCRFSTDSQSQGHSIESQIRNCRRFISKQWPNDHTEILILKDEGLSGKLLKRRPAYNELLDYVRKGQVKYVVVDRYDRLSRSGPYGEVDIRLIERKGTQVWSAAKEPRDPFLRPLIGLVNEKYLRDGAHHTLRGMRELAFQGFPPGGPVPFGWRGKRIDDPLGKRDKEGHIILRTVYEIVPEDAAVVLRIFKMYDRGVGLTNIAKTLNREHAPAPRRGKDGWAPASIRSILLNKKYAGVLQFDKRHFELSERETRVFRMKAPEDWLEVESLYIPAIVDLGLWNRIAAKFESRKGTGPTGPPTKHPLSGIVKCAVCGNGCHVVSSKRKGHVYRYIRCGVAAKRGESICDNTAYASHDKALEGLINGLERQLFSAENLAYLTSRVRSLVADMLSGSTNDRDALKKQLAAIERKIAGLISYIEENGAANPEIPKQLQDRCVERDELRRQLKNLGKGKVSSGSLNNLDSKISGLAGKTLELLTSATVDAFREEIRKHIRTVELHPDKRIRVVGTLDGLLQGAALPLTCKVVAGGRFSTCTDTKTFEFWLDSKGAAA